jgi:predicted metal-dependent hydrolase
MSIKKSITLFNAKVVYTVRTSRHARRMRLTVDCAEGVVITMPVFMRASRAEEFIRQKAAWVTKTLKFLREQTVPLPLSGSGLTEAEACRQALSLARARLEYWNKFYQFPYNQVFIKTYKRKWGSCSHRRHLNFNYRIIFLPPELADYIIVHELCHLGEMNHSRRFWNLVAKVMPDYLNRRRSLRRYV